MHEHDIEGELDAALARYAAVEPRGGLEQRVLANLRARRTRATRFTWERWVAALFAAASLAALLILIGERHATVLNVKPVIVQHEVATTSGSASTDSSIESAQEQTQKRVTTGSSERARNRQVARAKAKPVPKLAQFPAPEPLTEQEKLLIQFVDQDPQGAALFAEVRARELQRESDEIEPLGEGIRSQQGQTY